MSLRIQFVMWFDVYFYTPRTEVLTLGIRMGININIHIDASHNVCTCELNESTHCDATCDLVAAYAIC